MGEPRVRPAAIIAAGPYIDVTWTPDGRRTRLYSYWLKLIGARHTAYDDRAARWTDGANFQADDPTIREDDAIVSAAVNRDDTALAVRWGDGTERAVPLSVLARLVFDADPADVTPQRWRRGGHFPTFEHRHVMNPANDDALFEFLHQFLEFGLAILTHVPRDAHEVERVAERLSIIQPSHLGPTFSLRHDTASHHIGETSDAIPLHIDMVYKQHPPDLQMLHVLNMAAHGGQNTFVDAFTVADQLDASDLWWLRTKPVWFVAESETVHFRGLHPIAAFDPRGRFRGIHYNEYKIVFPATAPDALYFAYSRLQRIIRNPCNTCAVALSQDTIVLFDNLRTLHGRRAFDGDRYVRGCYLSADELKSRYRVLARARQSLTPLDVV